MKLIKVSLSSQSVVEKRTVAYIFFIGLDDRNERLVFKRIVENSCKPPGPEGPTDHCGQYFLITPKLLPNLVDMEVEAITIQCIFNGEFTVVSVCLEGFPNSFFLLQAPST